MIHDLSSPDSWLFCLLVGISFVTEKNTQMQILPLTAHLPGTLLPLGW